MVQFSVVADCRDMIGEVPIYCPQSNALWWIDILRPAIHRLNLNNDNLTTWHPDGGRLGSFALREHGGLLLATASGLQVFDPDTECQRPFKSKFIKPRDAIFNDGRCDRQGRFWVGTMKETFEPHGELFRVDPDGSVTRWDGDIIVPNGIAFSKDSSKMYFADTRRFTISSFDFASHTGSLSNKRFFSDMGNRRGRPDGSCVDCENYIWNAEYAGGQITRYAPDGKIDRVIQTPLSHPTSLCFGGPNLDTLFITSGSHALTTNQAAEEKLAGAVISFKPGVRGIVEARFAG